MFNILIIVIALSLAAYLMFSNKLASCANWKATVTPLASIMGSGFLVSAPLLAGIVGVKSIFFMVGLLILAFAIGGAIRFNIRYFEPIQNKKGIASSVAFMSRIVLAGAYFISVTYYLQLLSSFILNALNLKDPIAVPIITTGLLSVIGGIAIWKGLGMLENVEKYAISLNLGMIGALLVGLAVYNLQLYFSGNWHLPNISSTVDTHDMRIILGLLIVVQGFETSRYLGDEYSAEQRISTMKMAQLISAIIYIIFISLATVLFHSGLGTDVTAIISMTKPVAIVLPFLLSFTAIASQFSAAVADNEGGAGLIENITHHRLPIKYAYLLILIVTCTITWETNVNEIIAYASRAFALFYMLQCAVAFIVAWQDKAIIKRHFKLVSFAILSIICLLVFALGVPSA